MIKLALAQKRGEDKFLDPSALELCSFLFAGDSWDPRVLIEAEGSTPERWAQPRAEAHLTSCRGWHCGEGPQLISQASRETKIKVSERSATWRVQTHHSRMETEKKTKGKVEGGEGRPGWGTFYRKSQCVLSLETSGTGTAFRHHWRRRH